MKRLLVLSVVLVLWLATSAISGFDVAVVGLLACILSELYEIKHRLGAD